RGYECARAGHSTSPTQTAPAIPPTARLPMSRAKENCAAAPKPPPAPKRGRDKEARGSWGRLAGRGQVARRTQDRFDVILRAVQPCYGRVRVLKHGRTVRCHHHGNKQKPSNR